MRINIYSLALVIFSGVFIAHNVFAEKAKDRRPPKEKWSLVEMHATVKKIDVKKREVDLMGPNGNLMTLVAGDGVKRLNEVSIGDIVTAEYWTYMKAEFRNPTADEVKTPLTVIAEGGRAPADMDPSAEIGAVVKAVVTIEIVNRPYMEVTIKGPRGNYMTVPVEDEKLITQLKVGEQAVVTYAEAMALSLIKVD